MSRLSCLALLGLLIGALSERPLQAEPRAPSSFHVIGSLPAAPLSAAEMHATTGKAVLTVQQLLLLATRTTLGPGITVWTYSSQGDPLMVTATWDTGATAGAGTITGP